MTTCCSGLVAHLKPDPLVDGLEVYMVGGAVRDFLLGQPAGDRDWVVVGTTPQTMVQRGFLPVGADFPVFLHPHTKEEYALARTERKSGLGYRGFTFYTGADVSLEQDLQRRDLTINAMACSRDGQLYDPLGGLADLKARVLRHVARAFSEDPVRLMRLARFAARFGDFSIAPQTLQLASDLVACGEVDALVPERVWAELAKGLNTSYPARMIEVLQQTGALSRILPGLVFTPDIAAGLDCAVRQNLGLAARFALLCRLSDTPEQLGRHIRAPGECIDYARLLPYLLTALENSGLGPEQQLNLFERLDGFRKPARFMCLLQAARCVVPTVQPAVWQARLDAVRSIDAGAIARTRQGQPEQIRQALRDARLEVLASLEG